MTTAPRAAGCWPSWRDGWARVGRAPSILAAVWLLSVLSAAPLALTLQAALASHLGASQAAEAAATGVNVDWWQEFTAQASSLGASFTPRIIGFAATLDSLSGIADARRETMALVGALAAYATTWTWLVGGIIDRYARQRATRAHGFSAASGTYFPRFVRLGLLASPIYWWLFSYVHPWLFSDRIGTLTRDLASESGAFAWRGLGYVVFGALVVGLNVVVDYAKIRMVVEDRRSALAGLAAGLRYVRRHTRAAVGLYALNAACFLALVALWSRLAPGVTGAGLSMWGAFVMGQAFIGARLAARLHFLASQTSLFQASLAHAGYTAAPLPVWSEPPAVEALRDLRHRG